MRETAAAALQVDIALAAARKRAVPPILALQLQVACSLTRATQLSRLRLGLQLL
jgi:hypothetical protein